MLAPCKQIAEDVGALFECEEINNYVRIRTPLMYPDGDAVDLYLQEKEGVYTLTDLGESLQWLWMQQVSDKRTMKQERLIQGVAADAGVELFGGMLVIRLREPHELASSVMLLSQAVLRVADVWFTFRSRSTETIADQVADFLTEREVRFQESPKIIGRSGRAWRVDFQTRTPRRSSLVKIMSTGSTAAAKQITDSTVACWHDLSHLTSAGDACQLVSLVDDTVDIWSAEDIRRVENISEVAFWSRPDEFAEKLAA